MLKRAACPRGLPWSAFPAALFRGRGGVSVRGKKIEDPAAYGLLLKTGILQVTPGFIDLAVQSFILFQGEAEAFASRAKLSFPADSHRHTYVLTGRDGSSSGITGIDYSGHGATRQPVSRSMASRRLYFARRSDWVMEPGLK